MYANVRSILCVQKRAELELCVNINKRDIGGKGVAIMSRAVLKQHLV